MTKITEALASLKELNAYQLAGMADTHSPDTLASDGAEFLCSIRDSVVETLEWESRPESLFGDVEDLVEFVEHVRNVEATEEIADGAPSIYTYTKWKQFVDLAAWQEDVSELSGDETDLDKLSSIALYIIAERLVSALLDTVAEFES